MTNKTILSLCDFTGNWSRPYKEAGYQVICVDLQHGQDVRLLRFIDEPIHGILAAPPCDHFANVGAQHWERKGEIAIIEGLALVDACLRAVAIYHPEWWALENPVGRLKDYLGPPKRKFHPWMFGDAYTKRTWLWGNFTPPMPLFSAQARQIVEPEFVTIERSASRNKRLHQSTKDAVKYDRTTWLGSARKNERSATPTGFSLAFFESNP